MPQAKPAFPPIDTSVGNETYVPHSQDARIGYTGRDDNGNLRTRCVMCCDARPLTSAEPVYGLDLRRPWQHEGAWIGDELIAAAHDADRLRALIDAADWTGEIRRHDPACSDPECSTCGVSILALSARCQREHEDQQARWARARVGVIVEYGVQAELRCRVY